jgi:hypothetical protein
MNWPRYLLLPQQQQQQQQLTVIYIYYQVKLDVVPFFSLVVLLQILCVALIVST